MINAALPENMPRPPRPERLTHIIRFLAEDSDRVILSDHARERMDERDIVDVDVFRVLRKGSLKGAIEPGKRPREWRCKMVDRIRGAREVGVVTVVIQEERLFVVTVEWEDLR
jgi:hypothetical protein